MEKILENVKKELKEIGEQGLSSDNLEMVSKLTDIYKNLTEAKEESQMGRYSRGRYNDYRGYNDYNDYRDYSDGGYGRRGVPGSGRGGYRDGGYGNYNGGNRMREHLDKIADGTDMYEYGRDRYQHGGDEERMFEGLEKLMFGICMFVESAMDFAETPQEKEIIRKHIRKLQDM